MRSTITLLLTICFVSLFVLPVSVHAYVDPGTGSYVVQLVLGLLFGGVIGIKLYWSKIKKTIIRLVGKEPHAEEEKG